MSHDLPALSTKTVCTQGMRITSQGEAEGRTPSVQEKPKEADLEKEGDPKVPEEDNNKEEEKDNEERANNKNGGDSTS